MLGLALISIITLAGAATISGTVSNIGHENVFTHTAGFPASLNAGQANSFTNVNVANGQVITYTSTLPQDPNEGCSYIFSVNNEGVVSLQASNVGFAKSCGYIPAGDNKFNLLVNANS